MPSDARPGRRRREERRRAAAPRPPKTSQKVPRNSAPRRWTIVGGVMAAIVLEVAPDRRAGRAGRRREAGLAQRDAGSSPCSGSDSQVRRVVCSVQRQAVDHVVVVGADPGAVRVGGHAPAAGRRASSGRRPSSWPGRSSPRGCRSPGPRRNRTAHGEVTAVDRSAVHP